VCCVCGFLFEVIFLFVNQMSIKLSADAQEFFCGAVYEEGDTKKYVKPRGVYYNLSALPKIPFYEKIVEPSFVEQFRKENNRSVLLPAKVILDVEHDPRLPYVPSKKRVFIQSARLMKSLCISGKENYFCLKFSIYQRNLRQKMIMLLLCMPVLHLQIRHGWNT
jgi:hypothetical protein